MTITTKQLDAAAMNVAREFLHPGFAINMCAKPLRPCRICRKQRYALTSRIIRAVTDAAKGAAK